MNSYARLRNEAFCDLESLVPENAMGTTRKVKGFALHEPFPPARTLLQIKANNNPLMCVQRPGVKSSTSGGVVRRSFGVKYKRFIFSCSHFPYGLFHYNNFIISVLKIIFCLLNVSIQTVSKSEVSDTTKARPAVLKDTAATPSRTYVLK